jgi:hypothetical protein
MTAAHNIDLAAVLAERLTTAHPDVLRELLATFIHTLMARKPTPCAAPHRANAAPSTSTPATATATANSTPVQGPWIWRSRAAPRLLLSELAAGTP